MIVILYSKYDKKETVYKNAQDISCRVDFVNGEPVYQISLLQINHHEHIDISNISSFTAFDSKATWICDDNNIICPHCGQHYDKSILSITSGMNFCPKCGQSVDYDSYLHDTISDDAIDDAYEDDEEE
jgi:ribosomal protein L37AE/L43A